MRVVGIPQALPSQCRFCGSATREKYLDTEISEEFYGAWYFCEECFAGAAHMMGYLPLRTTEKLVRDNEDAQMIITDLQIRLDAALRAIENLNIAQSGYTNVMRVEDYGPNVDSIADRYDPELDSSRSSSESSSETLPEGTEQLVPREGTTSESSDDEGVDELRPTSSGPDFELSF